MGEIFLLIYFAVGYWAVGQTIYANRIIFGTFKDIFLEKFMLAFLLGWILIPIAIIKKILQK